MKPPLSPRMKRALRAARRALIARAYEAAADAAWMIRQGWGDEDEDAELAADLRRLARHLPLLAKQLETKRKVRR